MPHQTQYDSERTKLRPRIGVLVSTLTDEYQAAVLRGARDAALGRDAGLWCIVGGELASLDPWEARKNQVFELVGPDNVDALVVVAGGLSNQAGMAALAELCNRYHGFPVCTIAGTLPGTSSVVVDNMAGMREALLHLIRIHQRKRIAFIRGPEGNQDAEERYKTYLSILSENGLAFDPALVAPGVFSAQSGADAVRLFFDEHGFGPDDIDAIVAADDATAIGALEALSLRGIGVPDPIALVGFDDIEDARYCSPPLTTVRQPLQEQGEAAVRVLLNQLFGATVSDHVVLPTRTVFRRSCGCFAGDAAPVVARSSSMPTSFEVELLRRKDVIRAELARAARGCFSGVKSGWEDMLISAFADQLRTGSERFHRAFVGMLTSLLHNGVDVAAVEDVVTILRQQIILCLDQDWVLRNRAEDVFHEIRLATSVAVERSQAQRRMRSEHTAESVALATRRLSGSFSFESLSQAISAHLPQLGIRSYSIAVLDTEGKLAGTARQLVAHDEVVANFIAEAGSFPIRQFAPKAWIGPEYNRAFVATPLHAGDKPLGMCVLSFGDAAPYVYETLADVIGAAIQGVRLAERGAQPDHTPELLPAMESAGE